MARRTSSEPDRAATQILTNASGKLAVDVVVVAERLVDTPEWAAVLAFRIGAGDTRLFAHAVVAAPGNWDDRAARSKWVSRLGEQLSAWLPGSDRPQLTTRLVRSANTGDLERFARRYAKRLEGRLGVPLGATGDSSRKSRGAGSGDVQLARIAARYVELLDTSRTPVDDLTSEFGLARNTIQSYLYRARERGLLTSPGRGRAGGELTARATQLLTNKQGDES